MHLLFDPKATRKRFRFGWLHCRCGAHHGVVRCVLSWFSTTAFSRVVSIQRVRSVQEERDKVDQTGDQVGPIEKKEARSHLAPIDNSSRVACLRVLLASLSCCQSLGSFLRVKLGLSCLNKPFPPIPSYSVHSSPHGRKRRYKTKISRSIPFTTRTTCLSVVSPSLKMNKHSYETIETQICPNPVIIIPNNEPGGIRCFAT